MFEQFEDYGGPDLDFIWTSSCYPEINPVEHWVNIHLHRSVHGICHVHVCIFNKPNRGQYKYYKNLVEESNTRLDIGPISLAKALLQLFKIIEKYKCGPTSHISVSSGVHGSSNPGEIGTVLINGIKAKLPIWCIENIFIYDEPDNREYILFCQWLESYINLYVKPNTD